MESNGLTPTELPYSASAAYFKDCYEKSDMGCLSTLNLSEDLKNEMLYADDDRVYFCLYDSWLAVVEKFFNHGITNETGKSVNCK